MRKAAKTLLDLYTQLQAAQRRDEERETRVASAGDRTMSNIFDALQRAETEGSTRGSTLTLATELVGGSGTEVPRFRFHQRAGNESCEGRIIRAAPSSPLEVWIGVPFCPSQSRRKVAWSRWVKRAALGAEKFRFLAVRLRQLRQSRPLKKVLITSSIPQEGKSTVAANLACTLARRKPQKTLLLEGDLRRPNIAAQFGLGKLPGLCDWLSGETPSIHIYLLENLGVWILPAGSAPQNPWN